MVSNLLPEIDDMGRQASSRHLSEPQRMFTDMATSNL